MAALESDVVKSLFPDPVGHRSCHPTVFQRDEEFHRKLPFRLGTSAFRSDGFGIL